MKKKSVTFECVGRDSYRVVKTQNDLTWKPGLAYEHKVVEHAMRNDRFTDFIFVSHKSR